MINRAWAWLWRESLRRQMIAGFVLVIMVVMTLLVLDLVSRQKTFLQEKARKAALVQTGLVATSVRQGVMANDLVGLQEIMDVLARDKNVRYAFVTDTHGAVLAHTDPKLAGQFLQDATSLKVLRGPASSQIVLSGARTMDVAAPILLNGRPLGWVRLARDLSDDQAHLEYVTRAAFLYILAAIVFATVVAFALAGAILRPLRLLLQGAKRLSENRLGEPIPITTNNEVGRVSAAFNDAMSQLSRNIAEREKAEMLLIGQKQVLETIVSDVPLEESLTALMRLLESQMPGTLCSVLLLDADGVHLHNGAAPSLAAEYCAAIEGISIGPCVGSCGTAAFRREMVVVEDIANDPLWASFKSVALTHGLRACWSTPIFDAKHTVLGTFAIYSRQPARPEEIHLRLTSVATQTAAIAIQRHRAQKALRASERRFSTIFRTSPVGTCIFRQTDNRCVDVNEAFLRMVGYSREQLLGRTVAELNLFAFKSPEDQDAWMKKLTGEGRMHDEDMQLRRQSGELREVLASLERFEINEERMAVVVAADITERKQAADKIRELNANLEMRVEQRTAELARANEGLQAEIRERERVQLNLEREQFLLRTLMDNLPHNIYFKDLQSRFVRNNQAHLQSFGLTDQAQALGKTDFDFFAASHARRAFDDEQRIIRSGEPVIGEEKETWPDGRETWALTTKMPWRDAHGNIIGTFGISRDITEIKKAEQAIQDAREAAESANRAKSEFLANMSHELRTPLNSVIGFANILLKNKAGNLQPTETNFLGRILSNGMHLLGLINQILDLSKVEARKIELIWSQVSLADMVPDILAQFESQVRGRDLKLGGDVPPNVLPLRADEVRLKQIIINLMGNALKFTEKGSVTLRVAADPETHRATRIDVTDTGIGIPPDKLEKVFEAFQQADTTTERKYGGTGLGLTISRALCKLMGFDLVVQSGTGKGTTFSILIPTTAPDPATAKITSHPAVPVEAGLPDANSQTSPALPLPQLFTTQHKLVLVIDDDLEARLLLSHLVEECGSRVATAASGEEALRLAREVHPDLILLDLMMPEMNGWQVLDELKSDPALSRIPVVVASVIAAENRGTLLGALDVLQKPVTHADIQRVLFRLPHSKVLVVDDNDSDRLLMRTLLEADGVEVQTAVNGRDAVEVLRRFTPDLILLDLIMPEMDGMTFLECLRKDSAHEHLPVVIVTAKDLTEADRKQINHLAQAILKKAELLEPDLKRLLGKEN